MATPISSATSYASAADLINCHDEAAIGDWAALLNAPRLTAAQILTNEVVSDALLAASGRVEAACFRGGRYTPTNLGELTGASLKFLKRLVCHLAFYELAVRRIPDPKKVAGYEDAVLLLDALNKGEMIFGLQEAADAGTISAKVDLQYDSAGQANRVTEIAGRLFGQRMDNDISGVPRW